MDGGRAIGGGVPGQPRPASEGPATGSDEWASLGLPMFRRIEPDGPPEHVARATDAVPPPRTGDPEPLPPLRALDPAWPRRDPAPLFASGPATSLRPASAPGSRGSARAVVSVLVLLAGPATAGLLLAFAGTADLVPTVPEPARVASIAAPAPLDEGGGGRADAVPPDLARLAQVTLRLEEAEARARRSLDALAEAERQLRHSAAQLAALATNPVAEVLRAPEDETREPPPEPPFPVAALPDPAPPAPAPSPVEPAAPPEPSPVAAPIRVFLHLRPGEAPTEAQRAAIRSTGAELAALRTPAAVPSFPSVRWFRPEEAAAARRLAGALSETGLAPRLQDFTQYRPLPSPGTVEVWLPPAGATYVGSLPPG